MKKKIARIIGLLIVTACALVVVITVTTDGLSRSDKLADGDGDVAIPEVPVSVMDVELETIEITDSYSGMIRPLERFSLGFEIAGRLVALGSNDTGKPLDEGDRVAAGQVLARLDDRVLLARLKEAKARREQAQSNMRRAQELKDRRGGVITDTEYQDRVTELALAEAQFEMAESNLEDATLLSPVAGVISRRRVNAGESVNSQQTIMEIIQVEQLLLTVGVPEAYVGEISVGQTVHVELLARDRFRRKRAGPGGRVYRVAEAADDSTGLFEVEILISNSQGKLKPGQIGLAHVVVAEIRGFRVPMTCAVFRDEETYLFTVDDSRTAHRLDVAHWIEQGPDMILEELPPGRRTVVVRGQHRLVEGCGVRLVSAEGGTSIEIDRDTAVRTPRSAS